jgi:hypothetical protein
MSDPIDVFMREGILRYAEAQQTVSFFREQVFAALEDTVRSELREGALVLADKPDLRRMPGEGANQCWLMLSTNALRLPSDPVRLELGLWWNCPDDPAKAPCVAYVLLREYSPKHAKFAFREDARWPEVRAFHTSRWTRLAVTIQGQDDLRGALRTLVVAFCWALEQSVTMTT